MREDDEHGEFVRSSAVTERYHVVHDWSGDGSIVSTVVRAVREVSGREPAERLHDRIDPDGLDALFRSASGAAPRDEGEVTFPFAGYEVTVHADGRVFLE